MNTIEGGIYKDANGDGWHDANGKPVDKSGLAEAEKLQREYVQQFATPQAQPAQDSAQTLANALVTALGQRSQAPANPEPQPSGNVSDNPSVTDAKQLATETERRAGKQG